MKNISILIAISYLLLLVSCNSSDDEKIEAKVTNSIPVEISLAETVTFNHFIELTGRVEPVQYAYISPEGSGQIKSILVSEGDNVRKGEELARLNTSVIDGQIEQVKSQLELATVTYKKQDELWNEKHVGSEIQFLQAKAQKEGLESQLNALNSQKEMSIIKAPFSGVIDKINLKEGELASPGMKMIELVNLRKMKIISEASESLLPVIHKGDTVIISFPTYENIEIKAPIYRTANVINPANRTFIVESRINNIDNKLKPFMISTCKINDYSLKDAITLPSIIIKKDFDREFIFIAVKTDSSFVAKKTYIKTGRSYQERTVISEGLNIGDQVIVKGYNTVSDGVELTF